jgi:hypothetical protein
MIEEILYNKKPFMVTRPGWVEMESINKGNPTNLLLTNAGFYYDNISVFDEWSRQYIESMVNSDSVLIIKDWFGNGHWEKHLKPIFNKFKIPTNKGFIGEYPKDINFYLKFIETTSKDSKILIISPFTDTIEKNLENIHNIHPNHSIKKENIITLKTPQTIRGNVPPHNNWLETHTDLTEHIKGLDFDVALLSCGCYGQPLCNYIYKDLGKSAFYIGARLQLCFGIKGRRWASECGVTNLYNEHWVRPSSDEQPNNYNNVENSAYW